MEVRIFRNSSFRDLEKDINDYLQVLSNKKIIDIKYQFGEDVNSTVYTALIIFE